MASMLRSKAIKNVTKGNTSAYYSYLEEKNGTNPVIQQLDRELSDYMGFVKKKSSGQLKSDEYPPCKVSDTLFDIWNKFEPRVPPRLFYQKLMQMGEFLVQSKEYATASWQCYDRYLNLFSNANLEEVQTVDDLRRDFFPEGIDNPDSNSDVTFRALMGRCICMFHFILSFDKKLQNTNSIQQVNEIMRVLRLIMQLLLEIDHFCWLVYNGTIYMYTISRMMMQYGQSKIVLEYLLFCSVAMETCVPLLSVKYLPWRATLYAATCQCYFDLKFNEEGELFARRGLSKINELYELEMESVNGEKGVQGTQFREATLKVGIMLFKRIVFETRRKSRGMMRPKVRLNYKDLNNQQWPRTATEKLLNEMFDCSAAQFLAIEEALSDSNRRIAMPSPAGGEYDFEMLDVCLELLFAAEYLASGNITKNSSSGNIAGLPSSTTAMTEKTYPATEFKSKTPNTMTHPTTAMSVNEIAMVNFRALVLSNNSQISMAINGDTGIQIRNFLKIIKLAYNYEAWDIFRRLSNRIIAFIESIDELYELFKNEVLIIHLLLATDKYLVHLRKLKHAKNELIKASMAAAAKEREAGQQQQAQNEENGGEGGVSASRLGDKSAKSAKSGKSAQDGAQSKLDAKSQPSAKSQATTAATNRIKSKASAKSNDEKADEPAESIFSGSAQVDPSKEEDILTNIAHQLLQIIESEIPPDEFDMDVVTDITLLLWRKCKEVFQRYQTGAQDNYKWIQKLDNLHKWLFILNIVHSSMCYFNMSFIDPAVYAHCSLRLGLVYESLANYSLKKGGKDSNTETDDNSGGLRSTTGVKFSIFEMCDSFKEPFNASTDVRGNLLKAKIILNKSMESIAAARASTSRHDKTFLCDKDYSETNLDFSQEDFMSTRTATSTQKYEKLKAIKERPFKYKKDMESDSVNNLIGDLHVELFFLYYKISLRLLDYLDHVKQSNKQNAVEKEFEKLLSECRNSRVCQALLFMAKVLYLANSDSKYVDKTKQEQKSLAEKAYKKLLKAEEEDKMLYYKNVVVEAKNPVRSKIPPAPIICLRTHNKIVLQPRSFQPLDNSTPCWYRVFASQASNINFKARITDYNYPGCGEQVPANSLSKVAITGLTPNEKYIFAVGAYDKNGKLIGDSIGESSEPILAFNTLSTLMGWSYLCQACYQIGEHDLAQTAFQVLWDYFVIRVPKPSTETVVCKNEVDYRVTFHQLNYGVIERSSPVLIRKTLESFFIATDMQVKKKKIYCDMLFDGKIQYHSQIERIKECEKMIVAIELAAWLNDPQIILQAIVQIYGLLAPLIYYNLCYDPIAQVLSHCVCVLEEIQSSIFQRKMKGVFESLQHMIACTTFYLTDILKRTNKKALANHFNVIGRKLLGVEENTDDPDEVGEPEDQSKNTSDKHSKVKGKELKALDTASAKANAAKATGFFNVLTGSEDVAQIYSYVAQNATKFVYKELVKFRKRSNYMEMFVYLLQKALSEDMHSEVNEWASDTLDWLQKRNANILGSQAVMWRKYEGGGAIAIAGNVNLAQSHEIEAELINLQRSMLGTLMDNETMRLAKRVKPKIKKYKLLIPLNLDIIEKNKLEEKQKKAIDTLYDLLPELYDKWNRRKKMRKILQDESAHTAQLYVLVALNNYSLLINKIQSSLPGLVHRFNNSYYFDTQMFLFDKSNALIHVGIDGQNAHDNNSPVQATKSIQKPVNSKLNKMAKSMENLNKLTNSNVISTTSQSLDISKSYNKLSDKDFITEEKNNEYKDVSDLICGIISGIDQVNTGKNTDRNRGAYIKIMESELQKKTGPTASPLSPKEFTDVIANIFEKFRYAVVIAHRGKQWTQLQNICKLMFNTMNTLLAYLPAMQYSGKKAFTLKDLWLGVHTCLYIAADDLLDMLFQAFPIEKLNSKEMQQKINKWFESPSVGKIGASLHFDVPMDDITSIDLRFVKEFVFRTIQCLAECQKWEKLCTIGLKFNSLTSYRFGEQLMPVIVYAQNKLIKQTRMLSQLKQPHMERLKGELGRYPRVEDLFFINLRVVLEAEQVKPLELGVKIDPTAHNIYDRNKSLALISHPLNLEQSFEDLNKSLEASFYASRLLIHSRRLLALYILVETNQKEFFNLETTEFMKAQESFRDSHEQISKFANSDYFHSNPLNYACKKFEDETDVFIKGVVQIKLETVVESFKKTIELLHGHKEKDLAVQAMHELGNIYHYSGNKDLAYKFWNDALDELVGINDSLIKWRDEFKMNQDLATSRGTNSEIDGHRLVQRCGVWGCLLGGVLTSKMAQYYLSNDLELRTECCLFSATLFKSIYRASVPFPKYDLEYVSEDQELFQTDYLLPGLLFNSEMFRFDQRYIISSLNYICLELLNAGHYLYMMPVIVLYEYFARTLSRDLIHSSLARLIKIESLIKLNLFGQAISLLELFQKGDRLPSLFDEKSKQSTTTKSKFLEYTWNSAKPIFDLNNLKCLEGALSLKLPFNLVKVYGPHLTTRFNLVQCKLFIQIAGCLPCIPSFDLFTNSKLQKYHESHAISSTDSHLAFKMAFDQTINRGPKAKDKVSQVADEIEIEELSDNPDVIRIFTAPKTQLSLEHIKGSLLGTCKTILIKCLKIIAEDFPHVEKYTVSSYWMHEFKYECNMLMAQVADQSQLDYIALESVIEAMRELSDYEEEQQKRREEKKKTTQAQDKLRGNKQPKQAEKKIKYLKKGIYLTFDSISKSHLSTRLWMKARCMFVQFMFNQLADAGKAKGNDENIMRDFADLKYYVDRSIIESEAFYDQESKNFFQFIDASLDLIRGVSLVECEQKLDQCLLNYTTCKQMSVEAFASFLRTTLLKIDLSYSLSVLNNGDSRKNNFDEVLRLCMKNLIDVQSIVLNELKLNAGEAIEFYVDKERAYFDNMYCDTLKNVFNPLYHYLVHIKLRLGSSLMLKSAYIDYHNKPGEPSPDGFRSWQHALSVLASALELNKVICYRSIGLEAELKYKYAHCLRQLFTTRQIGTLIDVFDAYNSALNLICNSYHDLGQIKSCFQELAIAFISVYDVDILSSNVGHNRPSGPSQLLNSSLDSFQTNQSNISSSNLSLATRQAKKNAVQASRAVDGALVALSLAIRTANAIKEKTLLPGHDEIKSMTQMNAINSPQFIGNDLLAYYIFADRKRVFRDNIEAEVLLLAPEFDVKQTCTTYDDKIRMLEAESNSSLTWIHLLNYQTKLQNLSSMRNLNTLKNGKNRSKYSEYLTIGYSPVIKSITQLEARLYSVHSYFKNNLEIYKRECCSPVNHTIMEFIKVNARKVVAAATLGNKSATVSNQISIKSLLENVRAFNGNLGTNMTDVQPTKKKVSYEHETRHESDMTSSTSTLKQVNDWSYLQSWPPNYDHLNIPTTQTVNLVEPTIDQFVDYMITFNWYKSLIVNDYLESQDELIGILAIRDSLTKNKIKFRCLSAERVTEIHKKLAPLASIADTALQSKISVNNENEINIEYMNSLQSCIFMIAKLFEKDYTIKDVTKVPFELKPSNIVDLEKMFNIQFGGCSNDESLKIYLLDLFS